MLPANESLIKSRFLWQVWSTVGGLVLVSTLTFGLLTSNQLKSYVISNIEESLKDQAELLRILLSPQGIGQSGFDNNALKEFGLSRGIRITLIDKNGVVSFDNLEASRMMDNHGTRPEVIEAGLRGWGKALRFSQTLGKPMLYLAVPVKESIGGTGFIRVSVSLSEVDRQLRSLRKGIFLAGAIIAIFFLVISYWLVARFSRPILEMTEMSMNVAKGEYQLRLPVLRKDELGQLANALNQLAEGAQSRIGALEQNRNQLAAILSGLVEGVIAVDTDQLIVHINESALNLLGADKSEKFLNAYFGEKVENKAICQTVDSCLKTQEKMSEQIKFKDRILDLSLLPLKNNGVIVGAIVVLNDVTDMSRLSKIRTDFVANASHELKTPVTAIRGYIETISEDEDMAPEIRQKFIGRILNQTERLDKVVQDLMHLSRVDTNTLDIQMEELDLVSLLDEIVEDRFSEAEEAGILLTYSKGQDSLTIKGERIGLWQMITNLIDNAFKYTGEKGRVEIRLKRDRDQALLEIIDNGIGVEKEEQNRIFERFYRVDKARSRELGGTGLGLAIVKHVAQLHRGSIELISAPGKGSRFRIRLPLKTHSL